MRRVWTTPSRSVLRRWAIHLEEVAGGGTSWLTATPLARDQLRRDLARIRPDGPPPRVRSWCDLWRECREADQGLSPVLSEAASRSILVGVIRQAIEGRGLEQTGAVALSRGFVRRLRGKFAQWTRPWLLTRQDLGPSLDPIGREEWSLFLDYRRALRQAGAEDEVGGDFLASRRIADRGLPSGIDLGRPCVLDAGGLIEMQLGPLCRILETVESADLLILADADEADSPAGEVLRRLAEAGLEAEAILWDDERPAGLAELSGALRPGGVGGLVPEESRGLTIARAATPDGMARAIARLVRDWASRDALGPGDVVVACRTQGPWMQELRRLLANHGLSSSSRFTQPLARDPEVDALLSACRLSVEGWEVDSLIRLLRHGAIRPGLEPAASAWDLARVARDLAESGVARGWKALDRALSRGDRRGSGKSRSQTSGPDATRAPAAKSIGIFRRLVALIERGGEPARRAEHFGHLKRIAKALLPEESGPAIGRFLAAAQEHSNGRDPRGDPADSGSWPEYVREVEDLAHDLEFEESGGEDAIVWLMPPEDVIGLSPVALIVADMREGSYPRIDTLSDLRPGVGGLAASMARERSLFLRLIDAVDRRLVLAYAEHDERGEPLLTASFLEDVRRCLGPDSAGILAVAPEVEPALGPSVSEGVTIAVETESLRASHPEHGAYSGLIDDPAVLEQLARSFEPSRHVFSPSQLESYAFCPFQFFLRYVLRIAGAPEADEFRTDYAARGSRAHAVLERFHEALAESRARPGDEATGIPTPEELTRLSEEVLRSVPRDERGESPGRKAIEEERLRVSLRKYIHDYIDYLSEGRSNTTTYSCEMRFGAEARKAHDRPEPLVLGEGPSEVRVQGIIDRIDIGADGPAGTFRIIDYKTGHVPSRDEVRRGEALQLPLYAMALEQLGVLPPGPATVDLGYWGLRDQGYASVFAASAGDVGPADRPSGWPAYRDEVGRYVLEMADGIRRGHFPVSPRSADCHERCEYRDACRIGPIRGRERRPSWPGAPAAPGGGP